MKDPFKTDITLKIYKNSNIKLDLKLQTLYISIDRFIQSLVDDKEFLRNMFMLLIITFITFVSLSIDTKWVSFFLFLTIYPFVIIKTKKEKYINPSWTWIFYPFRLKNIWFIFIHIIIVFSLFWTIAFLVLPLLQIHAYPIFFYLLVVPAIFVIFLLNGLFFYPFILSPLESIKITFYMILNSFLTLVKMWIILILLHIPVEIYKVISDGLTDNYPWIQLFILLIIHVPITILSIYIVIEIVVNPLIKKDVT